MELVSEKRIGRRILRHIGSLLQNRLDPAGNEEAIYKHIVNVFHAENYHVVEQNATISTFPSMFFYRTGAVLWFVLLSASFLALPQSPLLAVELAILSFSLAIPYMRWTKLYEWLYRLRGFGASRVNNILAFHPSQRRHLNIVFAANYGTQPIHRFGVSESSLLATLFLTSLATFGCILLVAFVNIPYIWTLCGLIPSWITALILFISRSTKTPLRSEKETSGLAVILELAHSFAEEMPNANIVFLATGGDRIGQGGALALLKNGSFQEQLPPERTICLYFDDVTSGGPVIVYDRYALPRIKSGVLVSKLVSDIIARFGLRGKTRWIPTVSERDQVATAHYGYQTVTLSTAPKKSKKKKAKKPAEESMIDLSGLEYSFAIGRELVDSIPFVQTKEPIENDN